MVGLSVHREIACHPVIAASNVRDTVDYRVLTDGGSSDVAGSLSRSMLLAQRNEYHTDQQYFGYEKQPVVSFASEVTSIELSEPLPPIVTNAITIDGSRPGDSVEVVGRFITKTSVGDSVLSDTIVDGFTVAGDKASGTVLRNLQFGGFNNGSAYELMVLMK